MSTIIAAIVDCLRGNPEEDETYLAEKQSPARTYHARPLDEIAEDVVNTIVRAEKIGAGLKAELHAIVGPYGWKEYLAEKVLERLGAALQGAHDKLGPAIREAYHKAWEVANEIEGFVIQHPVMCTIIALGVLVIIAPWVIEALGFGELGPMEGAYIKCCMIYFRRHSLPQNRLFRFVVAIHIRRFGAQGFVVLLLPALGHGVAAALTKYRHVLHRTT